MRFCSHCKTEIPQNKGAWKKANGKYICLLCLPVPKGWGKK